MKNKLSDKYFLLRIVKSKDFIDLTTAIGAYAGYQKFRRDWVLQEYFDRVGKLDFLGATRVVTESVI